MAGLASTASDRAAAYFVAQVLQNYHIRQMWQYCKPDPWISFYY